jgi:hypothetical protein
MREGPLSAGAGGRLGPQHLARRLLLLTAALAFVPLVGVCRPVSSAHRSSGAVSLVRLRSDGKAVEIEHRLHAHDGELTLRAMEGESGSGADLVSLPARARLALYVERRFQIMALDGAAIPLILVGAELIGEDILVYQEASLNQTPQGFKINSTILLDAFPEQTSLVHVDLSFLGDGIRSLAFKAGDGFKTVIARPR